MTIRRMTFISLCAAILTVSVVLFPSIPLTQLNLSLTLQTLFVILIGFLLKPADAFLSVLIYVLLGAIGLPVFSQGRGGLSVLFGPSGGFIMLFPVVGLLISLLKSKTQNIVYDLWVGSLISIVFLYGFGTLWLSFSLSIPYASALSGMLIFIPFDLIKLLLAYTIYRRLPKSLIHSW
jgi:biotin transport system substrate-specific component